LKDLSDFLVKGKVVRALN